MAKKIDYASLYTKRKDGIFVGTYIDENGKRKYVYSKDPEILWHKLNDPKPEKKVLFSDIVDAWENEHTEQVGFKTAEGYIAPVRRIKEQFGEYEIREITAADVNAFLQWLARRGYARRTVQLHRDILNMVFNHAILGGYISANPCAAVSMPRNLPTSKRELPNDDAIAAVRAGVNQPFGLFAAICLYSGLRRGEALALEYNDIDKKKGVIRVTKAVEFVGNNPHIKTPKTAAGYRDAILPPMLADLIPNGKGYIFAREDGGLLTKTQYRKRWLKYCEAIGYNITAHQLRHGFATLLYEAGIEDKDAQELLGHSSITVTRDVYTHIRKSRRDSTAERFNDFLAEH